MNTNYTLEIKLRSFAYQVLGGGGGVIVRSINKMGRRTTPPVSDRSRLTRCKDDERSQHIPGRRETARSKYCKLLRQLP